MYNIAILEANSNHANELEALIRNNLHQEALEVIKCSSIVDLAKYLADGNVLSILFIDVWMGDQESAFDNSTDSSGTSISSIGDNLPKGVEVVEKYRRYFSRAQVIYTCDIQHYSSVIYKTDHAFFLAKPFVQDQVDCALAYALENLTNNAHNSLPVKIGTSVRLIKFSDIVYVESQRRKLRIHTHNEVVDIYGSLAAAASVLPVQFVQCHKSFIVNLDYAVELQKEGFVMASGEKVPVSQTKRKEARKCFMRYLSVDM